MSPTRRLGSPFGDAEVEVAGERLLLMPERAVFWARRKTLIITDTHWGKAAALRAAAVPVPSGTTLADLQRLDGALARTGARRLVFLGDLLHAKTGRAPETLAAIRGWREKRKRLEVLLVRGNHDLRAGDPPEEWGFQAVDEPLADGALCYRHVAKREAAGYCLAGHTHPSVVLSDGAGWKERLRCFYFGADYGLLPAFGSFTGTHTVRPRVGDRVFVIADDEVIRVGSA